MSCVAYLPYATGVSWAHPMKKNDSFVHIFLIYTLQTGCDHSFQFKRWKKIENFLSGVGDRQRWRVMGSCYYSCDFFWSIFHYPLFCYSNIFTHTLASRRSVIPCSNDNNNKICSKRAGVRLWFVLQMNSSVFFERHLFVMKNP